MKKHFLILATAMMFTCMLFAQTPAISTKYTDAEIAELIRRYKNSRSRDVRVDGALLQKFQRDFPNARSVEWETNGEIYEVEFDIRSREFEAYYDKDGNLLMYKQEIHARELPAVVKNAAEARLPGYRFDDIEKVRKGTQTTFVIEMERGDIEYKLVVSNDGQILSQRRD